MWNKVTLTTANNTTPLSFKGRGAIYAEGTFGSGQIELHIAYASEPGAAVSISTGYLDDALDGTSIKTIDCPAGDYQLQLTGSTGATVDVYFNDQVELIR